MDCARRGRGSCSPDATLCDCDRYGGGEEGSCSTTGGTSRDWGLLGVVRTDSGEEAASSHSWWELALALLRASAKAIPSACLCSCDWISINDLLFSSVFLDVSRKRERVTSPAGNTRGGGGWGEGMGASSDSLSDAPRSCGTKHVCVLRRGPGMKPSSLDLGVTSWKAPTCLAYSWPCLVGGIGAEVGADLDRFL